MKGNRISRKTSRFLAEKETLLDRLDDYQEELQALRRREDDRQLRAVLFNKMATRCKREGRILLGLMPWGAKEYRSLLLWEFLYIGLTALLVIGAGGGAYEAIRLSRWSIAALLCVVVFVLLRLASKIHGLLCDILVWRVLRLEYQPVSTVWSAEQQALLPKRLIPYMQPVANSVDPNNCIRGKLRCACGGHAFRVWRHPEKGYLTAICDSCGKEIVLFDEHLDSHGADGAAQHYFVHSLQMAQCPRCGEETHQVIVTVVSDQERSFFASQPTKSTEESGYGLIFELFCSTCGTPSGDGSYFWSRDWEQSNEQEGDTP